MDQENIVMNDLPASILRHLQQRNIAYRVLSVSKSVSLSNDMTVLDIEPHQVVRAVLLQDAGHHPLLTVLPYDQALDFAALKATLGVDYQLAPTAELPRVFTDCDPETIPPVGEAYRIDTLVDSSLLNKETLYFQPGRKGVFLKMSVREFRKMYEDARFERFSCRVIDITRQQGRCASGSEAGPGAGSDQSGEGVADFGRYMPIADVRRQLDQFYSLPQPPSLVNQLLVLKDSPEATLNDLVNCLAPHREISEQIQCLAAVPFFGGYSRDCDLRDTVQQLLGFRMTLHVALGFACLRHFHLNEDGPLGRLAFWKHALYTAMCALELTRKMPRSNRPESGMVFLATLLHNVGFMLLGDLFRPEFFLLNKLVEANPETPVTRLEYQVLGMGNARHLINMGHPRLGAWLMYAWKMPDAVVMAVAEHHNILYQGPHSIYAKLALLADRLVSGLELGDADEPGLPEQLLAETGINEEAALQALESIRTARPLLDRAIVLS